MNADALSFKGTQTPWRAVRGHGQYDRFVLGPDEDQGIADVFNVKDARLIVNAPHLLDVLLDAYRCATEEWDADAAGYQWIYDAQEVLAAAVGMTVDQWIAARDSEARS